MQRTPWVGWVSVLVVGAATLTGASATKPESKLVAGRTVALTGKRAAALSSLLGTRATAVVFVGTHCPISNRNAPELAALAKSVATKGGRVVLVYSNPGDLAEAESHAKEFGLTALPAILDRDQSVAKSFGATVTPQAFVLDAKGNVVYSGRIGNGDTGQGQPKATAATRHELADALLATVSGKKVLVAKTEPIGCVIEPAPRIAAGPTYAHDIAPILNANCVSCHREGEIGPLRLDGYAFAQRYAANIAKVVEKRVMPPWKPTDGCGDFAGVRKLTDAQVQTISAWAKNGAQPGPLAEAPAPPKMTKGWRLGEPDLVLSMSKAYKVPASGDDIYQCFVLPTGLTEDKEVVAVEYRAGNKRVVHHVLGFVDTNGAGRKRDEADPADGYTSFGGPGFIPTGEVGGWAPGNLPQFLPDGIARRLPKGSDVVMQVHYHPNGKVEEDTTQIGLYFAKKPITKHLRLMPLVAPLNIPPGESQYKTQLTMSMPTDGDAIFIVPHMHLLGRTIGVEATLPDGTKKPMVQIDDWDFNWQDTYTYKTPVSLPKGTRLTLKATYDNSTANPRQPNSPPKKVTWGEATTDEMCIAFIGYVAKNDNAPGSGLRQLFGN